MQQHSVTGTNPASGQRGGDAVGERVEFAEGETPGGIDHGGLVGPLPGGVAEDVVEPASLPVTGPAVLVGAVLRKRSETPYEIPLLALKCLVG